MERDRKYRFTWGLLGDLDLGRPNLGNRVRVEAYRLMQFSLRDILESQLGTEKADLIFREAGKLAGTEFYDRMIGAVTRFDQLAGRLQETFKEMGIGILRIENADLDTLRLELTVSEDIDCSGLPELGYPVCIYDEGFIAGVLGRFSGRDFAVREVDCWSNGSRTCRFIAEAVN